MPVHFGVINPKRFLRLPNIWKSIIKHMDSIDEEINKSLTSEEKFNLDPLDEERIQKTLQELDQKYIQHKEGFFIMAPSGAGKTHYVNHQKENSDGKRDWMDGDSLWQRSGAHPDREWWLESGETMDEIDRRSDIVTAEALKKGFWILGASNIWLKPDAIVIPNWERHVEMIKHRETHNYDGGAKSDRLGQVQGHREWIMRWTKKGVPVFESMEEATGALASSEKSSLEN